MDKIAHFIIVLVGKASADWSLFLKSVVVLLSTSNSAYLSFMAHGVLLYPTCVSHHCLHSLLRLILVTSTRVFFLLCWQLKYLYDLAKS
jgi:hypothetical protein